MIYTLDTNAVTAILRSDRKVMDELELRVRGGHDVTLNALSYFETKRGLKVEATRKKQLFEALLQEAAVIDLDRLALDVAADIYQDLRRQGPPWKTLTFSSQVSQSFTTPPSSPATSNTLSE